MQDHYKKLFLFGFNSMSSPLTPFFKSTFPLKSVKKRSFILNILNFSGCNLQTRGMKFNTWRRLIIGEMKLFVRGMKFKIQ